MLYSIHVIWFLCTKITLSYRILLYGKLFELWHIVKHSSKRVWIYPRHLLKYATPAAVSVIMIDHWCIQNLLIKNKTNKRAWCWWAVLIENIDTQICQGIVGNCNWRLGNRYLRSFLRSNHIQFSLSTVINWYNYVIYWIPQSGEWNTLYWATRAITTCQIKWKQSGANLKNAYTTIYAVLTKTAFTLRPNCGILKEFSYPFWPLVVHCRHSVSLPGIIVLDDSTIR